MENNVGEANDALAKAIKAVIAKLDDDNVIADGGDTISRMFKDSIARLDDKLSTSVIASEMEDAYEEMEEDSEEDDLDSVVYDDEDSPELSDETKRGRFNIQDSLPHRLKEPLDHETEAETSGAQPNIVLGLIDLSGNASTLNLFSGSSVVPAREKQPAYDGDVSESGPSIDTSRIYSYWPSYSASAHTPPSFYTPTPPSYFPGPPQPGGPIPPSDGPFDLTYRPTPPFFGSSDPTYRPTPPAYYPTHPAPHKNRRSHFEKRFAHFFKAHSFELLNEELPKDPKELQLLNQKMAEHIMCRHHEGRYDFSSKEDPEYYTRLPPLSPKTHPHAPLWLKDHPSNELILFGLSKMKSIKDVEPGHRPKIWERFSHFQNLNGTDLADEWIPVDDGGQMLELGQWMTINANRPPYTIPKFYDKHSDILPSFSPIMHPDYPCWLPQRLCCTNEEMNVNTFIKEKHDEHFRRLLVELTGEAHESLLNAPDMSSRELVNKYMTLKREMEQCQY
jgi:hypothetical protein